MKFLSDTTRPKPTTGSLDPIIDSVAVTILNDSSICNVSDTPSQIPKNGGSYLDEYIIESVDEMKKLKQHLHPTHQV